MKSSCLVLKSERTFERETREIPEPLGHQVRVQIKKVGICGSDVHYYAHGRCGSFLVNGPIILGHESSGIVQAVGPLVTTLKPGDLVAIEPGIPCRYCFECKIGKYNLCEHMRFLATPPIDGALCDYIIHEADFCHKLPSTVSLEEGALAEPLSVGLHAAKRTQVTAGTTVLILGAGPVGLLSLLACKAFGASFVAIADIKQERLDFSKTIGSDLAIDCSHFENCLQYLKHHAPPIDVTIDCSGVNSSLELAVAATKMGGKIGLVGRSSQTKQTVPLFEASDKEIDFIGIFRYVNLYPTALKLMASGQIKAGKLISHHFPLDQAEKAFALSETGKDGAIKVMFDL